MMRQYIASIVVLLVILACSVLLVQKALALVLAVLCVVVEWA